MAAWLLVNGMVLATILGLGHSRLSPRGHLAVKHQGGPSAGRRLHSKAGSTCALLAGIMSAFCSRPSCRRSRGNGSGRCSCSSWRAFSFWRTPRRFRAAERHSRGDRSWKWRSSFLGIFVTMVPALAGPGARRQGISASPSRGITSGLRAGFRVPRQRTHVSYIRHHGQSLRATFALFARGEGRGIVGPTGVASDQLRSGVFMGGADLHRQRVRTTWSRPSPMKRDFGRRRFLGTWVFVRDIFAGVWGGDSGVFLVATTASASPDSAPYTPGPLR